MATQRIGAFVAAVVVGLALSTSAQAGPFTLTDGNSVVSGDTANPSGSDTWLVDGVDNLFAQWFYFRLGSSGAASSVTTLPIDSEATFDTNGGPDDTLSVVYLGSGLRIEIGLALQGGAPASGTSDLIESIIIENVGESPVTLSFIQYSDFDLLNSALGDSATLVNAGTINQSKGGGIATESTVVGPSPNYAAVGTPGAVLGEFLGGGFTNLSIDLSTAVFPLNFGPGDMAWAFEWVMTLDPEETFSITKDKSLFIPEPATLALLGLGGLAMLRRRG